LQEVNEVYSAVLEEDFTWNQCNSFFKTYNIFLSVWVSYYLSFNERIGHYAW